MSTTCCNDHDQGDSSYDLENLFKPHDEYEIDNSVCNNIESGFGRVSTLDPTYLENVQNYVEPISSELSALDYLYEVLLEIRESEKCDEVLYEVIHDRSLNKKHDCNDFIINYIYVNCANNMQKP